ncbi:MAG: hypothetical protein ACRD6X_22560, partial [Pyrinomonadaceae bacterium]
IRSGDAPAAILKVSIDGGATEPVSRLTDAAAEGMISFSPDGKWLAYRHVAKNDNGVGVEPIYRIGVLSPDGSAEPKFFDLPMRRPIIEWSANDTFDYSTGTYKFSGLWRQPTDGRKSYELLEIPDRILNFAWSQDGKQLALSIGKQLGDAILITNFP